MTELIHEWQNVAGIHLGRRKTLTDMFNDDFGFAFAGNNPFFQLYMQARPASERLPVGAMRDDARRFYYNKLMRYEKQVFLVGRLKEIPHDLNIEFEERKARVRDLYPPQGYFTWTEENPEEEIKSKSMLGKAFHFKQCVLYPEMDGVSSEPDEVIPETIMPETPANPALFLLSLPWQQYILLIHKRRTWKLTLLNKNMAQMM